eukprot:344145-Hanusia_phi.AAC.1
MSSKLHFTLTRTICDAWTDRVSLCLSDTDFDCDEDIVSEHALSDICSFQSDTNSSKCSVRIATPLKKKDSALLSLWIASDCKNRSFVSCQQRYCGNISLHRGPPIQRALKVIARIDDMSQSETCSQQLVSPSLYKGLSDVDRLVDPCLVTDGLSPPLYYLFHRMISSMAPGESSIGVTISSDLVSWSMHKIVLSVSFQISDPQVFKDESNWYMLAGSPDLKHVSLYAANNFPFGWKQSAVLLQGSLFRNPNIFKSDGRWFLTVLTCTDSDDVCLPKLYHSSAVHGPYNAHAEYFGTIPSFNAWIIDLDFEMQGKIFYLQSNSSTGIKEMFLSVMDRLSIDGFTVSYQGGFIDYLNMTCNQAKIHQKLACNLLRVVANEHVVNNLSLLKEANFRVSIVVGSDHSLPEAMPPSSPLRQIACPQHNEDWCQNNSKNYDCEYRRPDEQYDGANFSLLNPLWLSWRGGPPGQVPTVSLTWRYWADRIYKIFEFIPVEGNETLFENACGVGTSLEIVALWFPGLKLAGSDLQIPCIDVIQRLMPQGHFCASDCSKLSWIPAESFDIVLCLAVIAHLDDREREITILENIRITKPGGWIIIEDRTGMNQRYWTEWQFLPFLDEVFIHDFLDGGYVVIMKKKSKESFEYHDQNDQVDSMEDEMLTSSQTQNPARRRMLRSIGIGT